MDAAERIIVLGCGVTEAGSPSPALQRRLCAAARAWHEGLAPSILASGGRRWWGRAEASVMAEALVALGVDSTRIELELCSLTTRENAYYCHRLMQDSASAGRAPQSVVLVTCDWHLPRALGHFRRAGLLCRPYPAPAPRRGLWPLRWAREYARTALDALTERSRFRAP